MPYLAIFGVEFSKTIVIFEISTLKFVYLQYFTLQCELSNCHCKRCGSYMQHVLTVLTYRFDSVYEYLF